MGCGKTCAADYLVKEYKYNIEKGIPLPSTYSNYPFELMEIGDSFSIGKYDIETSRNVRSAARHWTVRNKNNKKFTVRKQRDNTVRVWRIK